MSPDAAASARVERSFPRVSGDDPGVGKLMTQDWKFSPRERG